MDEPKSEEFGRTKESFKKFQSVLNFVDVVSILISIVLGFAILFATYQSFKSGLLLSTFVGYISAIITFLVISVSIKFFLNLLPISKQYNQYKISMKKYDEWKREQENIKLKKEERRFRYELEKKRRHECYWKSLSGKEFEKELSLLYKRKGYNVSLTPSTDDKGVDIIMTKNEKKIIVQCKAHKKPVGVGAIRELYGALNHFKSDKAILASVSGFTSGVKDFAKNKPIELVSLDQIIDIQNRKMIDDIDEDDNLVLG